MSLRRHELVEFCSERYPNIKWYIEGDDLHAEVSVNGDRYDRWHSIHPGGFPEDRVDHVVKGLVAVLATLVSAGHKPDLKVNEWRDYVLGHVDAIDAAWANWEFIGGKWFPNADAVLTALQNWAHLYKDRPEEAMRLLEIEKAKIEEAHARLP